MTHPVNSSQNVPDSDLTLNLARKADEFDRLGGSPLELGQVLDRAGEIRRGRRMRATMMMAAAVLAVALPAAVVVKDNDHVKKPITPAKELKVDRSPITLDGLKRSNGPLQGYAVDRRFQRADGSIGLSIGKGRVAAVAPIDGGVMVAVNSGGDLTAHFVNDQGGTTTEQSWPMQGGFAVSDGGNVAAFVQPDGMVVAVQDGGAHYFGLGTVPGVPGEAYFEATAVVGEDCSGAEQAECTVYVENKGTDQVVGAVAPHRDSVLVHPALKSLVEVSSKGFAAGITSVTGAGSCSAVLDQADDELWKTCDHRLLSFSPDGNRILASAAYADGGDTQLAVLDAHTGRNLLDLTTADQAFIHQMVWEDDHHVLATVYAGGRWGILRIGLDGVREYAVAPVEATKSAGDFTSPFVLPE